MPRGGPRSGAGRKIGGVAKIDADIRAKALEEGISPLDYMLGILRDETNGKEERMDAAKSAAPYVHSRLANVDAKVSGKDGGAITFTWLPPQS